MLNCIRINDNFKYPLVALEHLIKMQLKYALLPGIESQGVLVKVLAYKTC